MKTKAFLSASQLTLMALATVFTLIFTSCSGEESIDELLSNKTTPVTFMMPSNGDYYLFDYAGSHYVGSDTITTKSQKAEVDLRQGKHHTLWFRGLEHFSRDYVEGGTGDDYCDDGASIFFNPNDKTIEVAKRHINIATDVRCAECDVNVGEYLLPVQKLSFSSLTAKVRIIVYDNSPALYRSGIIGVVRGYPFVTSVHLFGAGFKTGNIPSELSYDVERASDDYYHYFEQIKDSPTENLIFSEQGKSITIEESDYILCPEGGIDNIQLTTEVREFDGGMIVTTQLPTFSLHRGYTTVLRGLLFSGSTADWSVTMEPYED